MPLRAIRYIEDHFGAFIETLKSLSRIPSISADPLAKDEMKRSAEAVRAAMVEAGLENCEVLEIPGALPYAYGEWLHAKGKPTLLLYAHHDVQPPGRPEHWKTPPFEPTLAGDGRLYARGIVDDKAGIVTHLAAVKAWLATTGSLPVNVKLIVEGEEEIGSDHLEEFLGRHKEKLAADVIVLTDTANLAAGLPSLTYRLRGICNLHIEVTALDHPLHSGMWGGPIADPVMAMAKILASLSDERGAPAICGLFDQVRPLSKREREAIAKLPFDQETFRADAGVQGGVKLVGEEGFGVYEKLWARPSVTVIALEASPIKGSSNQIVPSARARISVRLVPDMDPERTAALMVDHVKKAAPWGVRVHVEVEGSSPGWICVPEGPAFEAAKRALSRGFGREVALIGAGGSIPFVGPFAEAFGGAPALLLGLEDPICNAHSENESLNLDDWKKSMKGAVYLYEELASTAR
ncbi:MAG: M20/M25/M40 family metallo-hydrolase [Deltaproteobacteria bacterium]|nr:M20/M25/M40 family metallo-hydrolase [Deltaproteobacteria bacterium]